MIGASNICYLSFARTMTTKYANNLTKGRRFARRCTCSPGAATSTRAASACTATAKAPRSRRRFAAHDSEVKSIVAADGPVGPAYRQDLYRVNRSLAKRYSGQSLADAEKLYAEFVDVARAGAPHAELRADIRRAGNAPWVDDLAIPDDTSWIWAWYGKTGSYDNTQAWAAVDVPVRCSAGPTMPSCRPHLEAAR